MTKYLVLRHHGKSGDGDSWLIEREVDGVSAKAAIQAHLKGTDIGNGAEFVAVPSRSWSPVKVQVETALKFSS